MDKGALEEYDLVTMENSYSKQYLYNNGMRIYSGNKQILNENIPDFPIHSFDTSISKYDFIDDLEEKRIVEIGYADLKRLGYCLIPVKLRPNEKWRLRILVKYVIIRTSDAINFVIDKFEEDSLEPELKPEFIAEMKKRQKGRILNVPDYEKKLTPRRNV